MTTDSIKELVKRLRSAARAQSAGGGWADPCAIENTIDWSAADALEALAGEVERLKDRDAINATCHFQAAAINKLETERDRLKAALDAFVKHFGPLQDNAMLHEDVRNCYRLARKALGGDA